jgi:hypothetical protein
MNNNIEWFFNALSKFEPSDLNNIEDYMTAWDTLQETFGITDQDLLKYIDQKWNDIIVVEQMLQVGYTNSERITDTANVLFKRATNKSTPS